MIVWYVCGLALLVGGLLPAAGLAARGGPVERLVGLELAAAVTALLLLVLAQAGGQSSLLIVPLVLVVLSVAGTLVFTRLLRDP
ncbi:monovalent cation/H+ antiporter complex subunit F [Pseudonocardia kujensis]|uniref:monovalent cation/H+ antiporter complex subunit F n=1 Tax=Pseudonocardia kujensis TaxID=1128675 RepID=UPI001E2ED5B8|nr:monovalent cation/H+ antiporter complex subunit F [Pseudonocardia kujensis]MCE0766757.1 monovalent cation/H+ antiporter complex subunit F [Pseudonocardia kujensis]